MPFLHDIPIAPADFGLQAALAAESLPADDLSEPGRTFFAFDAHAGERVGYGGYELHGTDVLLRSVVVLPAARNTGMGRNIVALLLKRAHDAGGRRAFLLTTTAEAFFGKLGFEVVDRSQAPATILATREASSLCPARALLMFREVGS